MRCFTYTPNKKKVFTEGIDFSKYTYSKDLGTLKTASFQLYTEESCDMEYLLEHMKSRDIPDIFMYGCTVFKKGDSVSSVVPRECFLIEVPNTCRPSVKDKSMLMQTNIDTCLRLCFPDECYIDDTKSGKVITNEKGEPNLIDPPSTVNFNTESGIVLEF